MEPTSLLGLRLQITPQQGRFPAISLFMKAMIEKEQRELWGNDIFRELREI